MHTFDGIPVVGVTANSLRPIDGDQSLVFEFDWTTYTQQVGLVSQFGIRIDFQITSDIILDECNSIYINNTDSPYAIWVYFPNVRQIIQCEAGEWVNVPVYGGTTYCIVYVDTSSGVWPVQFNLGQLNPWTQIILSKQQTGSVVKSPAPYWIGTASPNQFEADTRSTWWPPNRKSRILPVLGDIVASYSLALNPNGIQNLTLPFAGNADINDQVLVIKQIHGSVYNVSAAALQFNSSLIIRNVSPPPIVQETLVFFGGIVPANWFIQGYIDLKDMNLPYHWGSGITPPPGLALNVNAGGNASIGLILHIVYTWANLEMT